MPKVKAPQSETPISPPELLIAVERLRPSDRLKRGPPKSWKNKKMTVGKKRNLGNTTETCFSQIQVEGRGMVVNSLALRRQRQEDL